VNIQIEDAEEEKSSVHLKEVIKTGEGVTTMGFGSDEAGFASTSVSCVCVCYQGNDGNVDHDQIQ